jgi:hypothetical protein
VVSDCLLLGCAEQLRVEVVPLFLRRLFFFHLNAMGTGVGLVANASDLPRHLSARFADRLADRNRVLDESGLWVLSFQPDTAFLDFLDRF